MKNGSRHVNNGAKSFIAQTPGLVIIKCIQYFCFSSSLFHAVLSDQFFGGLNNFIAKALIENKYDKKGRG